jgi:hypothetical protein
MNEKPLAIFAISNITITFIEEMIGHTFKLVLIWI